MRSKVGGRFVGVVCTVAILASVGCAMEVSDAEAAASDVDVADHALIDGTTTNARPEVGLLHTGGYCTATLISSHWFITAAHCFEYGNPTSGSLRIAGKDYDVSDAISIDGEPRSYDVAIGRLADDVPASDATPATLSSTHPADGDDVTAIGFGCTNRTTQAGTRVKRFREFEYGTSNHGCQGDSGGPIRRGNLNDGGAIVALMSAGNSTDDLFALPVRLVERIEATMRAYDLGQEVGIDRPGFDIEVITFQHGVLGALFCEEQCERHAKCRAYSYVSSSKRCYLKSAAARAVPAAGVTSGIPNDGSFDRPGGTTYSTPTVSRLDECESACARDSACAAFTYQSGTCRLKSNVPAADPTCSGCYSGHRRAEGAIDRMGSDYESLTVASSGECVKACAEDDGCLAYSFVIDSGRCYLKNAVRSPRVAPGIVSDVRRGFEININRRGSDYRNFYISTPRPELCQAACERESRCRAWTYVPPVPDLSKEDEDGNTLLNQPVATDARCWLKDKIPASSDGLGMVSGRKGMAFF